MFSLRHRLFSSAAAAASGGSSANGSAVSGAAYSIQQASRDLSRTIRRKADLPFRAEATKFNEFNADFFKSVDAFQLQRETLRREVQIKLEEDKLTNVNANPKAFNPTRFVQEAVAETGYIPPQEVMKPGEVEQPASEPWWERSKRIQAAQLANVPKPAALIKTGTEVHFMNGFFLTRFISEGGKMLPRYRTGLTSKQQRKLAKEVRKARQLGIIPIMQKFLPAFEANLPNQTLDNPLEGKWKPQPKRVFVNSTGLLDKPSRVDFNMDINELVYKARKEISRERQLALEFSFGFPEVDNMQSEESLRNYIIESNHEVPVSYSIHRLRFRAMEAAFDKMSPEERRKFLEERGGDISDCGTDDQVRMRGRQYLHAFEEQLFPEAPLYNRIRFAKGTMERLAFVPHKKSYIRPPSPTPPNA